MHISGFLYRFWRFLSYEDATASQVYRIRTWGCYSYCPCRRPPPNLLAKFHLDRSSRLGASQTHTDRRPSSAAILGCAASKSSAAAFVAKFLVQPPPPKKNIRLSRISWLAAEIFHQPADSRKNRLRALHSSEFGHLVRFISTETSVRLRVGL